MAYTLTQLEAIKRAYASGITRASYDGKSTEFRSLDEMRRIISEIETELGLKTRRRRIYTTTSGDKGL